MRKINSPNCLNNRVGSDYRGPKIILNFAENYLAVGNIVKIGTFEAFFVGKILFHSRPTEKS